MPPQALGQDGAMESSMTDLRGIAEHFALPAAVTSVEPLGNGNVNDTFRVETAGGQRFVLQRLNTHVFPRPELVMANIVALNRHVAGRGAPSGPQRERWELPEAIPLRAEAAESHGEPGGQAFQLEVPSGVWRLISHVDQATTHDTVLSLDHAAELGRGLGTFHRLIHDLPCAQLADTLEGFHITPAYLASYERVRANLQSSSPERRFDADERHCIAFVEQRRDLAGVLEQAKAAGVLQLRPIHGDPKVNNVMLDATSGRAVALVDLDTVKPGLVHYDIGDCLRSGCNPAGEECRDLDAVVFDLDRCRAILDGYLDQARGFLTPPDFDHLYVAGRLISFELGLRFFTDHLAGNRYFKVSHPRHNLERALVQFRLTESIEAQEPAIRAVIEELR
ncbi:phosphotransferase enzyme family protein [Cyanobium sp. NIES-981]|uniref:phosphotransferase enzyme family protein n=1 Tax=Cyanobium sp. NIES-981 TaxID=1851505 RepID=UPI0007DD574E|nr:aminoglycoside phosphotransferase family protein [Cyanobium sp. NIES-981]SBO42462.1 Aminoglycoside phosphotransferase [Cyanobium sp. NIES-981]